MEKKKKGWACWDRGCPNMGACDTCTLWTPDIRKASEVEKKKKKVEGARGGKRR